MVLHLLYGVGADAVFAVGVPLAGFSLDSPVVAAGLGLVYGIVRLIGGMAVWLRAVIGVEPDGQMMRTFVIVHLVYGVVLGGFLGAGVVA